MKKNIFVLIGCIFLSFSFGVYAQMQLSPEKIEAKNLSKKITHSSLEEKENLEIGYALPDENNRWNWNWTPLESGSEFGIYIAPEQLKASVTGKNPVITSYSLFIFDFKKGEVNYNNKSFTFKLFQDNGYYRFEEGELLHATNITANEYGWVTVTVSSPITLDLNKGYFLYFKAAGNSAVALSGVEVTNADRLGNYSKRSGRWNPVYWNETSSILPWVVVLGVEQEAVTYPVTFNIKDGNKPLEGASINIGQKNLTTNSSGIASTSLSDGVYGYSVSKSGYITINNSFTVNKLGETINLTLTVDPNVALLQNEYGSNLFLYPNPVDDFLFIGGFSDTQKIFVYNVNGVLIMEKEIEADEQLHVGDLAKGFYWIRISNVILKMIKK